MSHQRNTNSSAVTKLQQAYWEAKRNLGNSLGSHDDDCLISTDLDLDTRIQLLQAADNCYNSLLTALLDYKTTLCKIMMAEENLGSVLVEFGVKDTTQAGKLMTLSGKAISRSANQRAPLKSKIMELYLEVQTFQFKATVDVLQTVSKMEKVRKSYRSGLLWMKNESQNLDPDVTRKVKRFRRIQSHIKNLKAQFDAAKVESMQKIDLYLLSRCNLFSKTLVPYRDVFCKMSRNYVTVMKSAVRNIPSCSAYRFETLRHLNEYSTMVCMECHLKQAIRSKSFNKRISNLTSEFKCIHLQPGTNIKVAKSQTSQCSIVKRVKFKDPLESGPSNEAPSNNSETMLINLNVEDINPIIGWNEMPPEQDINFIPGKYSKDLLSIRLDGNSSGDSMQKEDERKDFENEFEKCFGLLDSVTALLPEEGSSELQFYSLIKNFGDLKEPNSEVSKYKSPINPSKISNSNSVSQWETILIEFDPYNDSLSRCLNRSVVEEDC